MDYANLAKAAYFAALKNPGQDTYEYQKAACQLPEFAYYFARFVQGADVEYCQEFVCNINHITEDPTNAYWAYQFAENVPNANIEVCQVAACKNPYYATIFATFIESADIEYCQESACQDPESAYYFAKAVKNADIAKCQEATYQEPFWTCMFLVDIDSADHTEGKKHLSGKTLERYNRAIMERCLK